MLINISVLRKESKFERFECANKILSTKNKIFYFECMVKRRKK
jgi:hypothetical protein